MRNALLILTAISFFSVTLWGQYPVIPKTGEGRYDRSSETVFLPNRIFTHPSVFFKDGQTDVRSMRKWWRAPLHTVSPMPLSSLKEEPVNPHLLSATGKPGVNPFGPSEVAVMRSLFSKSIDSFSGQANNMVFERDPFISTTSCRLTHHILKHLHPSGEHGFLFPAKERQQFFP